MTDTLTESGYNWEAFEAVTVERLREPKVQPVPAGIIKQAQRAVTGVTAPNGEVMHTLEYEFPAKELAIEFAKHMKHAGQHTNPVSTITVLVDPQGVAKGSEVNPNLVRWQAGKRRGRAAAE